MSAAIITGATGFLGSHFALNFIGKRFPNAYVIVRGTSEEDQRDKLHSALLRADESYLIRHDLADIHARITTVAGDITQPMLGLDDEELRRITHNERLEFWHFAASLNYEDRRRRDIEAANVDGTKNALEMARAVDARAFYHCSTAYTCGTEQGVISANWHDPHRLFNNHYERTKCEAEDYLKKEAEESAGNDNKRGRPCPQIVIFRPSVVIGNSKTKRPGGATTGFYGLLREFNIIKKMLSDPDNDVRMWVSRDSAVNGVAVDELMRQLGVVLDRQDTASKFSIVHLIGSSGPTNGEILELMRNKLNAHSLKILDGAPSNMTGLEELLDQRTEFYKGYLRARSDSAFVPSVDDAPAVSLAELEQYVDEALKTLSRRDIGTIFSYGRQTLSDGAPVNTYSSHNNVPRAVLLCNAVGMPVEFVVPLADRISKLCPVITWESRGLPSYASDVESLSTDLQRQVQDGVELLSSANVESALLIGWCTGARLAMEIASAWGGHVIGVGLLNGDYNLPNCERTLFEKNMHTIVPRIAADRRYADAFFKGIFSRKNGTSGSASQLLRSASAQDIYLANLPFQSADNLYTYARLLSAFDNAGPRLDKLRGIDTLVLTCVDDQTVSPQSSDIAAKLLPGCEFHMIEGGDHFSLYWDDKYIDLVERFVARALDTCPVNLDLDSDHGRVNDAVIPEPK